VSVPPSLSPVVASSKKSEIERRTSESDLLRLVTDAASVLGWSWVHFRSARTDKGWRTPVSGPLGQGWPDLILIRGARAIAAELKSQGGRVSEDQLRVLGILAGAGFETHTWRPADWPEIEAALR